jgi:primosomal protein N''
MKAQTLLKKAPVDLSGVAKKLSLVEAQELAHQLEFLAERAAAYAEYIEEACGTYGCGKRSHADAVKAFNRTRKKVRSAMGFMITPYISF